jgi:hypothetical protein
VVPQEVSRFDGGGQQFLDPGPQGGITRAGVVEE